MHERHGDGRLSTAVDGFPALTEGFRGLKIMHTSRMPSTKVENAFTTRNTHVHAIKSFSTMVETSSESEHGTVNSTSSTCPPTAPRFQGQETGYQAAPVGAIPSGDKGGSLLAAAANPSSATDSPTNNSPIPIITALLAVNAFLIAGVWPSRPLARLKDTKKLI
ncbi:hypothetical protein C8F04DRAFT_1303223 [Mycena alexandri]|uniref:Uncharacterized protein n=1 Tax=Mycena alexandri TaxID=1745969 RepID=A0AAD6SAC1_9AGAR|nr:hypothetical protein C8F04DRAFT_1303223 [Mycena alexandri]